MLTPSQGLKASRSSCSTPSQKQAAIPAADDTRVGIGGSSDIAMKLAKEAL